MDLKKSSMVVGVIVLIAVSMFFIFDGDITGNVAWEAGYENTCTDDDVGIIWDYVFKEKSEDNIVIYRETSGGPSDCTNDFAAAKGDGSDKIWMLYSNNGGEEIHFYYVQLDDGYSDIYGSLSYAIIAESMMGIMGAALGNITNQTMLGADGHVDYFDNIFEKSISGLDVEILGFMSAYKFIESKTINGTEYDNKYYVFDNKSLIWINSSFVPMVEDVVSFTDDIDNFTFERNSSWNDAFDIGDHFSIEDYFNVVHNVTFVVNALGNNTSGEWINYTINGDSVEFEPTTGFLGTREFNITGEGISSNNFNVTIVADVNDAPELVKDFESISVSRNGSETIYLDVYFEDPEEDDMTFSVSGETENLTINISGETMTIRLNSTFNNSAEIYVTASDGEYSKKSNKIWVFENSLAAVVLVENITGVENETVEENASAASSSSGGDSTNQSSNTGAGEGIDLGWLKWVGIILVVIILILFAIWFFVLRRGNIPIIGGDVVSVANEIPIPPTEPTISAPVIPAAAPIQPAVPNPIIPAAPVNPAPVAPQAPGQNSVNDYMKGLNLKK